MKAQSAIEYLVTYGWMLVAVSVVSGTIYSFTGQECLESTSGFTGNSLQINDFGVSSENEIKLLAESRSDQNIQVKKIEFQNQGDSRELELYQDLEPFGTSNLDIPGFRQSDSCNTLDVNIIYDIGVLENQSVSGSITANIELDDTQPPLSPDSFNAAFPNL